MQKTVKWATDDRDEPEPDRLPLALGAAAAARIATPMSVSGTNSASGRQS